MSGEQQSHVLVVDDNEMNRDMLTRRLTRQGCIVAIAENGYQALEMIQAQAAELDLILLDIMMPKLNGYQVLEQLKADPQLQHIPVIVISAVDDLESVVRCIEMGAEDYLFKPFNPVLLKARIGASLDKKRLRDQERAYTEQMYAAMQEAQAVKSDFLTLVAQELEVPVSTIRAHLERLAGEQAGHLSAAQSESVETIGSNVEHIVAILAELANETRLT
ncbi:MAG: response regulator [Burkholderiales bacterium]|nr:response regulator [Anaerolineae bacterium]